MTVRESPLFSQIAIEAQVAASWVPLLADATGISIRRGGSREGLGIKTDVGLCTFRLLDAQDPLAGGLLAPGQNLRVKKGATPIFTGRIAYLNSVYLLNKQTGETRTVVEVTAADAVQIHASTQRYGVTMGLTTNETFEARIGRLDDSALAPIESPAVGAPRVVYSF